MKRILLLTIQSLFVIFICYGQRLEYASAFAPSDDWVKPAETPYRADICLNGSWQFQPLVLPAGFREGVDAPPVLPAVGDSWEKTPIRIPSPWNVNSFADQHGQGGDFRTFPSYPRSWETIKMGWLRKTFTVPAGWKEKEIMLRFEAVAGDVEVLVNGKPAGKHFGIFLPFELDVTRFILPGKENEICIGVRKASLFDKKGNYGRRTYQGGSFWGQHIAGIWQDVFLVSLPRVHASDVYVRPEVGADILEAEVTVRNDQDKDISVTIDGKVDALQLPAVSAQVPAHGEVKKTLSAFVKGQLNTWSPSHPQLYGLVISLHANGKTVDNKYTRFGWREVTIQGSKVLLNGQPLTMRGDSWHFLGIPQMTRRYAQAWFKAAKDAHLNAIRLHAQPYPSFYLDVADEMGMLILDETAIWASDGGPKLDDPDFWHDTKDHIAGLIMRDRNHPSVFGWSVSNEVMPVVTNVMRNPPGVKDTLIKYYGIWVDLCRRLDPTRQWISADGEDDGQGRFPVYVVHYGGPEAMERGRKSGKPWGVGEAGNAYYGTPEQVSESNGDRAYASFPGRMEGVAISSYQSLIQQREKEAVYRSVFNMVWYGLKPLPLGLKDTTRPPTLEDGVHFTYFKEGVPGVQPERLGPYCTTLNPGYDPSLPLYQTWPLFDAIRDAGEEPPAGTDKWVTKRQIAAPAAPVEASVRSIKLLGSAGSALAKELGRTGVPLVRLNTAGTPELLFIDGVHPPDRDARPTIDKVLDQGGTVVIWGVSHDGAAALNALLPAAIEITDRTASSLRQEIPDKLTEGIRASDLYFSESRPAEIITHGLTGPLAAQSAVLLQAASTDWLKWNRQPEYAKTAMIIRSEREKQLPGAAFIVKKMGKGRLIVTTLPAAPVLLRAEALVRHLLANMGIPLEAGNDAGKPLLKDGRLVRALYSTDQRSWTPLFNENGAMELHRAKDTTWLSFWVSSPRSLEDLLVEPNIPVINMEISATSAARLYLNDQLIISGQGKAVALKLHQGWNHFLIQAPPSDGRGRFSGRLTCNQPDFLEGLESALEKP